MLIKPVSGHCNMGCVYCFYNDVAKNREVYDHGTMSLQLLETIVEKAFGEGAEFLSFGFQGGEPTLIGIDFYKTFVGLVKRYNKNKAKTSFAIQTNGMAINDEWAEFFKENSFLIGLSIDGPKDIHDKLRHDTKGGPTHDMCIKAAKLLTRHKVDFNILTVVTRQLASRPDAAYNFYKKNNFRYIQFIPCIDDFEEGHSPFFSLDVQNYGFFLCRVFDLWYKDFIGGDYYSIRAFDNYIQMLAGYPPENCAMNGHCNAYALIEADGSVYPCDFYAIDKYCLGNIGEDSIKQLLRGKIAKDFMAPSRISSEQCIICEYYRICRGGCRRDREPLTEEGLRLNYYCGAYKMFFPHSLPRMAAIARSKI